MRGSTLENYAPLGCWYCSGGSFEDPRNHRNSLGMIGGGDMLVPRPRKVLGWGNVALIIGAQVVGPK